MYSSPVIGFSNLVEIFFAYSNIYLPIYFLVRSDTIKKSIMLYTFINECVLGIPSLITTLILEKDKISGNLVLRISRN